MSCSGTLRHAQGGIEPALRTLAKTLITAFDLGYNQSEYLLVFDSGLPDYLCAWNSNKAD